jgi:hypothetical protein
VRVVFAMLVLASGGCTLGGDGPATPRSPAAEGAARAAVLAEAAAKVQRDALALQAMSDPEQVAAGAAPPHPADLERALEQVEEDVAASRAALSAVEAGARATGDP